MELKNGDIVYLKSDPRLIMTVNDASGKGHGFYECLWFAQELLQIGHFHKDALVKAEPKK